MATPRTTRSSASSTPAQSRAATPLRQKRAGSSGKKGRHPQQAKHRPRAASSYARSVAAVARCIAGIRRKLIVEAPAYEIIDDFFEGVTCEPAFTFEFHLGPGWLSDAIARSCEEILDKPTGQSTMFLVAVPEHDLVHGSVVLDGYMGTAVFFEDIRLGAVGLFPDDESWPVHFIRLVGTDEPPKPRGAPN